MKEDPNATPVHHGPLGAGGRLLVDVSLDQAQMKLDLNRLAGFPQTSKSIEPTKLILPNLTPNTAKHGPFNHHVFTG